ncbi:MAG: hypothetical protein IPL28_19335 [Chloroflexi bacterium]|nr:hypothetical protein [Chloroflexota bacterium]
MLFNNSAPEENDEMIPADGALRGRLYFFACSSSSSSVVCSIASTGSNKCKGLNLSAWRKTTNWLGY